ncbi:MAG: hypothetical protein V3V10_06535 [Planctomycetota bacterium]
MKKVVLRLLSFAVLRLEWSEIHLDFNPPWLAIANLPNRKMEIPEMLRPTFAVLKQANGPMFPQGADKVPKEHERRQKHN